MITLALRGEGYAYQNINISEPWEGVGGSHVNANFVFKLFLIEHLVCRLLSFITRFFLIFINLSCLFVFAINNHLVTDELQDELQDERQDEWQDECR